MDQRTAIVVFAFLAAAFIFEAGQQFERIRQRRQRRLPPDERKLRQGVCPICYGQKGTAFGDCGFCRGTGRPPGIVTLTDDERVFLLAAVPCLMADTIKNREESTPVKTTTTYTYRNLMHKDFERIIGFFTKPQTEEEKKQ